MTPFPACTGCCSHNKSKAECHVFTRSAAGILHFRKTDPWIQCCHIHECNNPCSINWNDLYLGTLITYYLRCMNVNFKHSSVNTNVCLKKCYELLGRPSYNSYDEMIKINDISVYSDK